MSKFSPSKSPSVPCCDDSQPCKIPRPSGGASVHSDAVINSSFICAACETITHFRCVHGLRPYLKKDGNPSAAGSEVLKNASLAKLCNICTRRIRTERLLVGRSSPLKETNASVQNLNTIISKVAEEMDALRQGQTQLLAKFVDVEKESKKAAGNRSYAAAASADIDQLVEKTARVVAAQTQKTSSEAEKRARSVVIDNLKPKRGVSDRDLVQELLADHLEVAVTIVDAHRMGRPHENSSRPLKMKVVLASVSEHAHVTSPTIRAQLRDEESEQLYPRVYIAPSRSSEDRHTLWLLRKRRNELNENINRPQDHWISDSVRLRLWKKEGGQVNRNIRDAEWAQWRAAQDSGPPRLSGGNALSQSSNHNNSSYLTPTRNSPTPRRETPN